MIKPTPTTCMAMSLPMPKDEQATGMSSNEPPATPEAPQAPMVDTMQSSNAVGKSTGIPNVKAADRDKVAMVMDAPAMLTVAPRGIDTVYVSGLRPSRLHRLRLTGILAAELRVKNAYKPLSRRVIHTSGKGLRRMFEKYDERIHDKSHEEE